MCVILIDRALEYESHANFWTTKKWTKRIETLCSDEQYTHRYNVAKKSEYGGARDIHRRNIAVYTKRMCISDPKCDDVISMRFSVFVPLLFFFSFITKHIGCATILIAMNNFYCFQIQNQNHIRKISKNSFCCNKYLHTHPIHIHLVASDL